MFSKKSNKISLTACVFFIFLLGLNFISGQENETSKFYELENGLKVTLFERHTLPLINFVFAVNLGSKDETEETNGLVHILEHYILFRGTEFRSGSEISLDARRHGAYFNAHTGHDIATFELSLPSEHAEFALEILKEILFHLKLTQEELDEEKQVILEELNQIQDDPMKYATSLVYQNLFQNHPYERPIYGKKEIIESTSVEEIEKFYRSYFVPSNCSLAVLGDFKLSKMEGDIIRIFGDIPGGNFSPREFEKTTLLKKSVEIEKIMDVNQGYLVIGMPGPDYNNPAQYATDTLIEIQGKGINPMLNSSLRGRRIMANSISMGFSAHKFGGAILIYIVLDPKKLNTAKREVIKFLKNSRNQNYSAEDYMGNARYDVIDFLESAKNQIKFKIHRSQEKGLLVATSLARYMLLNEIPDRGSYLENIEKISSSDLRKTAGEYFSQGRYVVVSILPMKNK